MKLRRLPEDFQVEELTAMEPGGGPFALYRLTKTSIGTPEAITAIGAKWNIHRKRISYGGLKDRHAVTVQYLTIHNGPRRALNQKSLSLEYLGQVRSAFTSAEMHGNRFRLVLRDMTASEIQHAVAAVDSVRLTGLPNYFDDQRFGSLGVSREWIAKEWCLGNWERALWLALADPHEHDSASDKQQKQLLRDMWGRWPECQQSLDRSSRRSIVTYMSDKVKSGRDPDYRGALARISIDLRGLYLSAWQSALWNRLLTSFLQVSCDAAALDHFSLLSGPCVFPRQLSDAVQKTLLSTELPLPCARIERPEGLIGDLLDAVLADEQIELRQIRVKYPRDSFFSKGLRKAIITPEGLQCEVADDELSPGRQKLTLSFSLPRGSYATILVKRITGTAELQSEDGTN
jgi:tRNA pseudouridine13 synthase